MVVYGIPENPSIADKNKARRETPWRFRSSGYASRHPPAILRQVRGSGAASPQPLHRDEKDGTGCHILLHRDDVSRLGGEAGGGAYQEYSYSDSESSQEIPANEKVLGRAETV